MQRKKRTVSKEETLNQFEMGTAGSDTSISACTVGMHEI